MENKELDEQMKKIAEGLLSGETVSMMRGISAKELEAVYSVGFNFYQSGKLDEADKVFRFLVMFDHTNHKYWVGLGAVAQCRKDYPLAITAYTYAFVLDSSDPKPQYYVAQCYLAIDDREHAKTSLDILADTVPEGSPFRAKAAELMKKIDEE